MPTNPSLMSMPSAPNKGALVSAPKRNLFDFNTVAPAPISKPQTTNEQIMARLLPQGTATQQIRNVTAPVIKTPATQTAISQTQNKPMYSDSVKLELWKQHGGDESNFDTNDFDKSASGAMYLKNQALSKIKPKESFLPTANAGEKVDTIKAFYENTQIPDEDKQLVSDAIDQGMSRADAENYLTTQYSKKDILTPKEEEKGLFSKLGEDIENRIAQAGEQQPTALEGGLQFGGALGGLVGDIVMDLASSAYETAGSPGKDTVKEIIKTPVGQAGVQAISKGAEAYNQWKQENPRVANDLENVVNIASILPIGKAGQVAGKTVKQVSNKVVVAPIKGVKQVATRTIPKKVVSNDLGFTPTERAKIERITGKDEATYVLEKNLAGKGKEQMAEHFMNQSNEMYNGITEKLAKTNTVVRSDTAKEALQDIVDQLESKPKIKRAYQSDIDAAKAMMEKGEYSLSDLNNIRRAYDKVNTGMYTAQGQVRSGIENEIDVRVRNALSEQLQKEAKKSGIDVKDMNTELRAGLVMKDALLRRLSQEERNNFIGLQDLGISAILSGGNPVTAIATVAAKKYGEKVAPSLSQKAYNLNKSVNEARTVNRGNTISTSNKPNGLGLTNSNMNNNTSIKIKQLPPPSGNATSANVVNVKPIIAKPTWQQKKPGFINPKAMAEDLGLANKSLIDEAKKYKSAEEFIKAQGKPVYHGTTDNFNEFKLQNGRELGPNAIFVSPQRGVAYYYAQGIGRGGKGKIVNASLKDGNFFDYKNPKDIEKISKYIDKNYEKLADKWNLNTEYATKDFIINEIKNGGYQYIEKPDIQKFISDSKYDGFHIRDYTGGDGIGIFNLSKIKTESQLKKIWEEAHKK